MTETPLRTFLSPILRVLRRLCFRADMHYNLRDVCLNSLKKEKKVLKLKPRDWFWHSRTGMLSRKSIINKYFPRTSQWTPPKHSVRYIEFSPYRLIIEQQTTLLQQSYVHPNCIHFFFFCPQETRGETFSDTYTRVVASSFRMPILYWYLYIIFYPDKVSVIPHAGASNELSFISKSRIWASSLNPKYDHINI